MGLSSDSRNRASINITPLIDVVLVLLIVFMVASPLVTRSMPVKVPPKAEAGAVVARPTVVVTLGLGGHVDLAVGASREQLSVLDLATRLRGVDMSGSDVFVDFDREVPYRDAVALSDLVRGAGARDISLVMR